MSVNGSPSVVLLAGPNGAGKTTAAPAILRESLAVREFVNADVIAAGLSSFNAEAAAVTAGRVMIARLRELARQRVSFAFETTLASRTFATWLRRLVADGYAFDLAFLWLPSADMAVARVSARTAAGGHAVPEDVVRRRWRGGLRNFFTLYRQLATRWRVYDNSFAGGPRLVVRGSGDHVSWTGDARTWAEIQRSASL